jgi:hypothetical protein
MRAATLNGFLIISTLVMSNLSANAAGSETQNGRSCPENDAAVVILSKKAYCAGHHLSGDACQARWEEYFVETNRNNRFLAECRMQHSSGAGSTSGTAATGSATPGSVTPGTLPSTAPAQNLRSTTGVIQNQQTLDNSQDHPSTIPSDRASPVGVDTLAGETVTNSQRGSGGTATGRRSTVRNNTSDSRTAVIGPGALSYPARLERGLPVTP